MWKPILSTSKLTMAIDVNKFIESIVLNTFEKSEVV